MKYKLTEMTLDLRAGTVLCRCTFTIQAVYQVDFTLNEADLYAAAEVDGRDSWENEDVISVIARKLLFWPGHAKRLESGLGPEERGGLAPTARVIWITC